MPKKGPDAAHWKAKLRAFASGQYKFGKGEKPGKGSRWEKELSKILGCPKHKNEGTFSLLSNKPLQCICGYHVSPTLLCNIRMYMPLCIQWLVLHSNPS